MKTFIIFSIAILVNIDLFAQLPNHWNVPLTEQLIAHNRENFSDHQNSQTIQATSTATVSAWKQFNDKFKDLHDKLEKRTNQIFALLADVSTALRVAQSFQNIADWEWKTINEYGNNLIMVPFLIQGQVRVFNESYNTLLYVNMLAHAFGDLNKLDAGSRIQIMKILHMKLAMLETMAQSNYNSAKKFNLKKRVDNSRPMLMLNHDIRVINDIRKSWRF
jgi:hypothetical protein